MRTRVYPLALGKILKHSLTNVHREVIGLLVGKQHGSVLEIWDAVTGGQRGNPGYVELHEEVQADVAEKLRDENAGLYVVGWYHSHPGMGLFLSGIDMETQRRYQALFPRAVALVIDPIIYKSTKKASDLKFKVFRVGKGGRVFQNVVTVGAGRDKVLESTLYGLSTLDIRHVLDVDFKPDQGLTTTWSVDAKKEMEEEGFSSRHSVRPEDADLVFDPPGNATTPNSFAEYLLLRIGSVRGLIAMTLAALAIILLIAIILAIR